LITAMPIRAHQHLFEPGSNPTSPPLLLLHGTGGDEHDLVPLARRLSPGSALLSPRGAVSEGGALRFFARLGEGVFDPQEIVRRTHTLADFIAVASKRYGFASSELIALGLSNGANIAATLLLLRPESLGGGILLRPMVVLDQPATAHSLDGKRVLISSGQFDPIVPPDHPEHLAELLRRGGADVTVKTHSASHALTSADMAAAETWLRGILPTRVSG
jgi:phospholipase/carboxylesterase